MENENNRIKRYTIFAQALALAAVLMFLYPIGRYVCFGDGYDFEKYANFVGGTAGPLGALAGFIFVYIAFQGQQEQIKKHDEQFNYQSFESTFFKLIGHYRVLSDKYSKPEDKYNLDNLIQGLKTHYVNEIKKYEKEGKEIKFIIDNFESAYSSNLKNGVFKVHSMIKCVSTILEHIASSDSPVNRKYFLKILYNQFSLTEVRVIFYYVFIKETILDDLEQQHLFEFIMTFNEKHIFSPSHMEWIKRKRP